MARYDDFSDKDRFLYAVTCSRRSLGSLLLARLDENQRLTKEFLIFLDGWIDKLAAVRADIRDINMFRDHGEEIVSRLSSSPQRLPYEPLRLPPASLGKKKAG